MVLPAVASRIASGAARKLFRDARGRFISKKKYDLLKRTSKITGRFLSKENALLERQKNAWLTNVLGRPPAGQEWIKIAAKYADRFSDLLRDMNQDL